MTCLNCGLEAYLKPGGLCLLCDSKYSAAIGRGLKLRDRTVYSSKRSLEEDIERLDKIRRED